MDSVDKDAAGHVSTVAAPRGGGAGSCNGGAAGKKRKQEDGAATKASGGKMEGLHMQASKSSCTNANV